MDLITTTNKEFHENGKLAYIETIAIIPPLFKSLYQNQRITKEGIIFIRIAQQAKYFNNGQLAWIMNYDDKGNYIKDNISSYRKDGTLIIY